MKTAAHCLTPYLHTDGSWLYHQIVHLRRYRPVVLTQGSANLDEFPLEALCTAEEYPLARRWCNRVLRKLRGEYPFYAGILRREGAVLIHAHFGYEGCRCLGARRAAGLPMLTSFYGADLSRAPRDPHWRRRYRELFAAGELFLVEGSAAAAQLEAAGCPAAKIRLHRLGVDLGRLPWRRRRPAAKIRFLICAAFREKKGVPLALRALGKALEVGDFPCELVLIGDGPERPRVLEAIAAARLGERVDLRGFQPYSRVLEELPRCHILLQTSTRAADGDTEGGAPVVLLEAQASGMPVVATRHADIPEYVREGESGLLAPERDVDAIAECIRTLVEHPERWAAMGRAGRRHVARNYNAATQSARLEEIYDEFS